MKTLEDVIKAYECKKNIEDKCNECPYFYECDDKYHCECEARDNDALHYLKTIETTENLYHDAVNELSKWIEEDWKDRCLPLTWDELKQMEGKPVWLEDQFQNDVKTWCIVERIVKDEDCEYIILDGIYFPKDYLGKKIDGWQAYRKERE